MGIYDNLDKQNAKSTTKGGIFADLDKQNAKANGTYVSKGKKVLNFGKELVKDTAMTFARVGAGFEDKVLKPIETKIVGKETVRPPSFIGGKEVTGLGQGLTGKEKAKDIIGGLVEGLSNVAGGGAVKNVVKTGLKGTIKKAAVQGFKEGAATGFANTFGKELQEQKSIKDAAVSGLKTAAIAGPAGLILGAGSGYLGSKLSSKIKTKPITELTSYEGAPDLKQVEKYKADIKAGNPVEPIKVIKDSSGNLGIEDGKHRFEAYKQLGYKDVPIEEIQLRQTNKVTMPKLDPETGAPMKQEIPTVSKTTTKATEDTVPQTTVVQPQTPSKFKPGSKEYSYENISKEFELDPKRVEDIATNLRTDTTNGVPQDAYLAWLKDKADETLDVDLIEKLKQSEVGSFSGQKLQANQFAKEDNIVDVSKDIEKALMKKKGINSKSLDKEARDISNKISEVFDSFRDQPATKEAIINALESIKCK